MRLDAITGDLLEWIKKLNITYDRTTSSKGWKEKKYFRDDHINLIQLTNFRSRKYLLVSGRKSLSLAQGVYENMKTLQR